MVTGSWQSDASNGGTDQCALSCINRNPHVAKEDTGTLYEPIIPAPFVQCYGRLVSEGSADRLYT